MGSRVKLQSDSSVLLLGFGYVARRLAPILQAQGHRVTATYRRDVPTDNAINFVKFGSAEMQTAFETADIILSSVPPSDGGDPVLAALGDVATSAPWVGYLSATSVYGDRGGQWAFEDEPPTPSLPRGKARADAEIAWLERGWPVHIFRLAGIYGPGRAPFQRLRNGQARAVIKDGHVVNRIHVDDIITALLASISRPDPLRIYNIADGRPAQPQDVLDFAAKLILAPTAKRVEVDDPELSEMAKSFYKETKRIDNSRARQELGWAPQYPTYQEGLQAILQESRHAAKKA